MKISKNIIENKPFTAYPSDYLSYPTNRGITFLSFPELKTWNFLKTIFKRYEYNYAVKRKLAGRYTILVSNDKKTWSKIYDTFIPI